MALVTLNLTGFRSETEVLVRVARDLGRYHREGRQSDFIRTLESLGMGSDEAQGYWEALLSSKECNGEWRHARSNSELASLLGVLLDGQKILRNRLLYRLVECHFPDILQARFTGIHHLGGKASRGNPPERRMVYFDKFPLGKDGQLMAIHHLYKGVQPAQFTSEVLRAAVPLQEVLGEVLGIKVAEFIFNHKMLIPPPTVARLLARVIEDGQQGRPITVVGAFCPDYAYEETGNPQIPYRYTFEGIGQGVGLVAQQFARVVPGFSQLLAELGISHKIVLAIGDFEADSQAVLDCVGVDRTEFVRRCQGSLDAFRQIVPHDIPLQLELFAADRGGELFRRYAAEATARFLQNDFGHMVNVYPNLHDVIARIPAQYRTFYERWYGRGMDDGQVREIVFAQAGEYSAMARIFTKDFGSNLIVLAGDRPEMHLFNSLYQPVAVLCAKRVY